MRPLAALLLTLLAAAPAAAHPLRTGYLELERASGEVYRVLWTMPDEPELVRAVELRLDPGCAPLAPPEAVRRAGRLVRTWTVRCPGGLAGTRVAAEGLAAAQADLLVRVVDGDSVHAGRLAPSAPTMAIPAAASTAAVGATYLALGVEHILLGVDHLLFVAALVLLVPGWRRLLATVTAFTAAHSLTLGAAVLGFVRLPSAPVEALIALSIALVAAEIVRGGPQGSGERQPGPSRAWLFAFAFGLLHGLGFAGALREVGLPAPSILPALLAFNLGVELGQLAFVAALLPIVALLRRLPPKGQILAPYAVGALAMSWTVERVVAFWG